MLFGLTRQLPTTEEKQEGKSVEVHRSESTCRSAYMCTTVHIRGVNK